MLHPLYGMNSPLISVSLVRHSLLHVLHHTWHFIIFTIFTITASVFSYSLSVSLRSQDLALQQILPSIDLFLYYRIDYTDYRTIYDFTVLNGCTGKCVRLSGLLAFECTLNHYTFISFYFIISLTLQCKGLVIYHT